MSLRAFPRTPKNAYKMLKNLFIIRTFEGIMRKIVGQPWNERNERLALSKTNKQYLP
jgi:hypothetical protein